MSSQRRAAADALTELAEELRGKATYALVGAGLSVSSGLPTWEALLDELLPMPKRVQGKAMGAVRRRKKVDRRIRDEVVHRDLPWRAQLIEEQLDKQVLRRRLAARFIRKRHAVSDAVAAVIQLPFQHILTTNYDNVLDFAHLELFKTKPRVLCWDSQKERSAFIRAIGGVPGPRSERCYVHLHGRATRPQSCVFTEEDYRELYVRSHALSRNLYALFSTRTVTFIGFSLSDPDFVAILREVQAIGSGLPRHYAILPKPKDGDDGLEGYLRGKYGVRPILYANETGRHEGLTPLLESLIELTEKERDWAHVSREGPRPDGKKRDKDDPNAGYFGGSPRRDGFQLKLTSFTCWDDTWLTLELEVTRDGKPPATEVAFYLHPTFPEEVVRVNATRGKCLLPVHAWGAFTVGAVVRETGTVLELDLAKVQRLPAWFREG